MQIRHAELRQSEVGLGFFCYRPVWRNRPSNLNYSNPESGKSAIRTSLYSLPQVSYIENSVCDLRGIQTARKESADR